MKRIGLIILVIAITTGIKAQNEVDALRYSNLMFGGSARFVALGGAFGAIGGDFSTLSVNPAGIGIYRTSEVLFSPSIYTGKTVSDYNGKSLDDIRYNFNLGNAGMVLCFPLNQPKDKPGWRQMQFGFGINRSQNYNNRILLEGENYKSSLLDSWVKDAHGSEYDELERFSTQLGWDTWLLDTISGSTTEYKNAKPAGGVIQRKSIESSGSMNEWVFSLGANYNDRFYIGGTIGFPTFKYKELSTYSETAISDSIANTAFQNFRYHSDLTTTGSGINFKLGFIFRPVDFIRIGAAIHTPTSFYSIHDKYSNKVESSFANGDNYQADSPEGEFDYKLTTPMRVTGGIAFIIKEYGLISADYEYVDYSEARLRSDEDEDFFDANNNIRSNYTAAHNLKIGTEWRIDQFSIRGGYGIYGSPFKSGVNDGEKTTISFGFGFREKDYFIDFAYLYSKANEDYYLYEIGSDQLNPVKNELITQHFIMSLGFKF